MFPAIKGGILVGGDWMGGWVGQQPVTHLDKPHDAQGQGYGQSCEAIASLLLSINSCYGTIQAEHATFAWRRIKDDTAHLQWGLVLSDGQIDVLIEIGAAIGEYVKDQRMRIKVHVLYQL